MLVRAVRQLLQAHQALVDPLLVRLRGGEIRLDLFIGDDAALGGVHQEHAAGLQAGALHNRGGVQIQHAGLRGHHDQSIVGNPNTGRP